MHNIVCTCNVAILAPTGELVPAKMVLQPDGEYKVEYSSRFTGKFFISVPFFLNRCTNFLVVYNWMNIL